MSYIGPVVSLAAQVGQYAFSQFTKKTQTEERTVLFERPTLPKGPSIDEIRARYGAPKPPIAPNLSTMNRQIAYKPVLGTSERVTPVIEQRIDREEFSATQETSVARISPSTSYASEFDTSVACLPCMRGHVSAINVAANETVACLERGDVEGAKKNLARLAGEAVVFERFDMTQEKLANTPPEDLAIIQSIAPQIRSLVQQMPTAPLEVVGAWSAVDESLRFARSSKPTDKDFAEIHERVADAEDLANYAEREVLSPSGAASLLPEQKDAAREALQHMRHGRHTLTDAQTLDLPTLEAISTELEQATVLLTPTPEPEQAKEIAAQAKAIRKSLDDAIRAKMQAQLSQASD